MNLEKPVGIDHSNKSKETRTNVAIYYLKLWLANNSVKIYEV